MLSPPVLSVVVGLRYTAVYRSVAVPLNPANTSDPELQERNAIYDSELLVGGNCGAPKNI